MGHLTKPEDDIPIRTSSTPMVAQFTHHYSEQNKTISLEGIVQSMSNANCKTSGRKLNIFSGIPLTGTSSMIAQLNFGISIVAAINRWICRQMGVGFVAQSFICI